MTARPATNEDGQLLLDARQLWRDIRAATTGWEMNAVAAKAARSAISTEHRQALQHEFAKRCRELGWVRERRTWR